MITFENPETAVKLTTEQAHKLGIDTSQEEIRLITGHRGPWQIITTCKGLCISATYTRETYTRCTQLTIYGQRSLERPTQGGYELEGRVSIKSKKYSAFTSSILVNVDGKLMNIGVIHARQVK